MNVFKGCIEVLGITAGTISASSLIVPLALSGLFLFFILLVSSLRARFDHCPGVASQPYMWLFHYSRGNNVNSNRRIGYTDVVFAHADAEKCTIMVWRSYGFGDLLG